MFDLLRRKSRSTGGVLFRGSIPIPLERFEYLRELGIELEPRPAAPEQLWAARVRHPDWGDAELSCPRQSFAPPREVVEFDPRLIRSEVEPIVDCASSIDVAMVHERQNVLRERKLALRLLSAIMGEHGVSVVDYGCGRFWSRAALDEELAHDADLDIDSLFMLHAVRADDGDELGVSWLHSHGLGELGYFDFDILNPSEDVTSGISDLTRALAFGIVEGWIEPESAAVMVANPGGVFRMVPASQFQARAPERFARLRDDPDGSHSARRSVLCEPATGIWSKLFGGKVEPSRWLREPVDENTVVHFSSAASALMAERARGSWTLFLRYREEFRELGARCIVKLGLPVDHDKGSPTDREHLWFEVTDSSEARVTGTLLNQPWSIDGLKQGASHTYAIDVLSDWSVFTPAGRITPTEGVAVRILREHRDELVAALNDSRDQKS